MNSVQVNSAWGGHGVSFRGGYGVSFRGGYGVSFRGGAVSRPALVGSSNGMGAFGRMSGEDF